MIEIILIAIVLVVVIPVGFLMSTSIAAAAIGGLMKDNAELLDPETELIETNV